MRAWRLILGVVPASAPALAILLAASLGLGVAGPASAAQVCAWMEETLQPDNVHHLKLWLSSDREVSFLVEVSGDGIVDGGGASNAPTSTSFSLEPGQPDSPWSYGANLNPPGHIDVSVILHAPTPSIFDPPGPVIATFTFRRDAPASETAPPATLATKQCAQVP